MTITRLVQAELGALVISPSTPFIGQTVTIQARLTSPDIATPLPDTLIAFYDGSQLIGSVAVDSNGFATLLHTFGIGNHPLEARLVATRVIPARCQA